MVAGLARWFWFAARAVLRKTKATLSGLLCVRNSRPIKYIAGGHAALSGPERDSPDWLSDIKKVKAPFGAFFLNKIIDFVDFGFGIWSRRLIKVENEI